MPSHRAAIRAAAVVTKIRQNRPPSAAVSSPSRRTTPTETPNPSQWVNPYPRGERFSPSTGRSTDSRPLDLPKPPFVQVLDPAVFSHPSLAGDPRTFKFEKPTNVLNKWDRRVESFEKLEHFGKSLLRMTLTELVTNHYASLTVPAVETLVNNLLSQTHLKDLSDHYALSDRLLSDPLANKYLRLSTSVRISLFYAYTAGIYHQEGVTYATQWIRQCFRNGLDEEYKAMKRDLFPKDVEASTTIRDAPPHLTVSDEPQPPNPSRTVESVGTAGRDTSSSVGAEQSKPPKPRNQSPVIPEIMPLVQLDAWIKQNHLPGPEWEYAVRGIAPDQVFKAELTVGDKTVQGSGKTKNWARQSAAAAYLGIKDLDKRVFESSLLPLREDSYTPRLFEFLKEFDLPRPQFTTKPDPKSPRYKCTLEIGDQVFVATTWEIGKVGVRREVSKMALDHFVPRHRLETRLLNYVRSHEYSIAFSYFDVPASTTATSFTTGTTTTNATESQSEAREWTCRIQVRGEGEKLGQSEEIAEVVGKGRTKIFAREAAVVRAAEIFGIDQDRKLVTESQEQVSEPVEPKEGTDELVSQQESNESQVPSPLVLQ